MQTNARNRVNRRSHTGILIYLNTAPFVWYSKAQTTVESSTFGSEFVALRIATDLFGGLWYKLCIVGVPIDSLTNVRTDNLSVVQNFTIHPPPLRKNIILSVITDCVKQSWQELLGLLIFPSKENSADMFPKPLRAVLLHYSAQCFFLNDPFDQLKCMISSFEI